MVVGRRENDNDPISHGTGNEGRELHYVINAWIGEREMFAATRKAYTRGQKYT